MATVVDELILKFSLDPSNFDKGQKKTIDGLRKLEEDARTAGKGVEDSGQKMVDAFSRVTKEVLGLGAAFLGVSGLKDLVVKTVGNQDALGKTASLLDVNTEALNRWINAVRLAGGSATGAGSSLSTLITTFGRYKTGQSEPSELGLRTLGAIDPKLDWNSFFVKGDWEGFLKAIGERFKADPSKFGPGVRHALGQEFPGASDDLLLLLQNPKMQSFLAESLTATEAQTKASRNIAEEFTRLELAIEEGVNRITPQIESWAVGFAKGATLVVKDPVRGAGAGAAGFMAPILGGIAAGERWLLGRNGDGGGATPPPGGRTPYPPMNGVLDANDTGSRGTGRWIAPYLAAQGYHETLEAGGFGAFRDVNTDNSSAIHIAHVSITPPPGTDAHAWASTFISSVTSQASSGSR